MKRQRTLIFTGDGKGKTTAALGMMLRAAGHGQRVLLIQFLKSCSDTGELQALPHLPKIDFVQMGCGFVPMPSDPAFEKHRSMAEKALAFAREAVNTARHDLIILDEICGAIAKNLISEQEVIALLDLPMRNACIVLTGRGASATLQAHADTVTEMRCLRHGYQQGIVAEEGVEF